MNALDADAGLRAGPRNLITDVPGVLVGNASNQHIKSGTTVVTATRPFVASVDVMGGAPGTRETECLAPDRLVDTVDAIVLSGGSAFGLDAASGVADALRRQGRGYRVGPVRVPIVPAAIVFDLLAGGVHDWVDNPWRHLGIEALAAAGPEFALGSVGAGEGATTANLKGGLGSASLVLPNGVTVGALVVANPNGAAVERNSGRFWAAANEIDAEFGARGMPASGSAIRIPHNEKLAAYLALTGTKASADTGLPGGNTTLAIVATDLPLGKPGLKRLAVAAQDGMARALFPAHTPIDGDIVFALSTGDASSAIARSSAVHDDAGIDAVGLRLLLGHAASLCVSRAIARAVYEAEMKPRDTLPCWRARYA